MKLAICGGYLSSHFAHCPSENMRAAYSRLSKISEQEFASAEKSTVEKILDTVVALGLRKPEVEGTTRFRMGFRDNNGSCIVLTLWREHEGHGFDCRDTEKIYERLDDTGKEFFTLAYCKNDISRARYKIESAQKSLDYYSEMSGGRIPKWIKPSHII